uniref:Putative isopenicillin N synthase-like protein n=1 Tax=Helianthus annuus TaxID=4232 RepID=A0A251UZN8_HELAN
MSVASCFVGAVSEEVRLQERRPLIKFALSNGKYKSCLHRVSVNSLSPRLSLVFFLCPKGDRELKAPQELVEKDGKKEYPDFTWGEFLQFTQKNHRADENTLQLFTKWLLTSKNRNA